MKRHITGEPKRAHEVRPRISKPINIGRYLNSESANRLGYLLQHFNRYRSSINNETLKIESIKGLRRLANELRESFITKFLSSEQETEKHLRDNLNSVFWSLDNDSNFKGATSQRRANMIGDNIFRSYLGTVGEFLDEARLKHKAITSGKKRWVIGHSGGSGETGIDVIILKRDGNEYKINCHEVKLTTQESKREYGYSGLPKLYRDNYEESGQRKSGDNIEYAICNKIRNHPDISPDVKREVEKLLSEGKIPISWKYATWGNAIVNSKANVRQTKIGKRGSSAKGNSLSVWFDVMRRGEKRKKVSQDQEDGSSKRRKLAHQLDQDDEEVVKVELLDQANVEELAEEDMNVEELTEQEMNVEDLAQQDLNVEDLADEERNVDND